MAVAGGTAPSLLLHFFRDLGIIVIEHGENRLIRIQEDKVDEDGNVVLKRNGKPAKVMVPTGAVELDLPAAARKLASGEHVWVRADDREKLTRVMKRDTCPRPLLSLRYGVNREL